MEPGDFVLTKHAGVVTNEDKTFVSAIPSLSRVNPYLHNFSLSSRKFYVNSKYF